MFTRHLWPALRCFSLALALAATPAHAHQGGRHPTGLDECDDIQLALAWFFLYGTGVESGPAQDPFEVQDYTLKNDQADGYLPQATVQIAWALGWGHITGYDDFIAIVRVGASRSLTCEARDLPLRWIVNPYLDGWSGLFTVTLKHKRCSFTMTARARWALKNPCEPCRTVTCAGTANIKSVEVHIPVGITDYGRSPIQLEYLSEQVANEGIEKLALRGPVGVNGAVVQSEDGLMTGVVSGGHFARIVPDPSTGDPKRFRVDVSHDKADPANTIYRQAWVENIVLPDGAAALRYTDSSGGKTSAHVFTRPDADTWVLEENGLRRTTKTKLAESATARSFRFQVEEKNASGHYVTIRVRDESETRYEWGWEKTREVLDPDGAAIATAWDYCDFTEVSAPDGSITGQGSLQRTTYPTGLTRIYEYYDTDPLDAAFSRLTITRDAFAGMPGARETRLHSTSNGLTLTERLETWVNGILVEHTDIAAASSGGTAWRTETRYPSGGGPPHVTHFEHEPTPNTPLEQTTIFPDGTIEVETGTHAGGLRSSSVYRGVDNPGLYGLPILTGTEERTVTNDSGQVLQMASFHIRDGAAYRLEERIASQLDDLSRPTAVDVFHGIGTAPTSTETTEYGCCGISKFTGEDGIPIHYYYDDLGRLRKTHRNGLATETIHDGLTTRTHLYPEPAASGLSLAAPSTEAAYVTLNLAGDPAFQATRSPQDNSLVGTSQKITYNPGNGIGRRIVHTLPPTADDLGVPPTIIEEFYLDGRPATRTGPLVADSRTTYAVNAAGVTATTSLVDDSGSAHQSITTQFDWMGRPVSRTYAGDADGDSQPDREYLEYGPEGRLVKQVDPDGVTLLWSHDLLNESTTSALDLNANGIIDPDIDELRIRRSGTAVNAGNQLVAWSEELIRESDGTDTLVTRGETRTDGRESWFYTFDGGASALSHSLTTRLSALPGAWDITIRNPDQTALVQRFRLGRLANDEEFDAEGRSLSTRSYDYDSQERLIHLADSSRPNLTTTYVSPLVDAPATHAVGTHLTAFTYDHRGRLTVVDQTDGIDATGVPVDNRRVTAYWPHGAPREISGSPGHRLAYTYDHAHRIETLATYGSTTATTRWIYDRDRGWLSAKRYDSPTPATGTGPTFTYTAAGRLDTRSSPRAIATSHRYGPDGRPSRTDYSDGTPSTVILERDRRGRVSRLRDAGGDTHLSYNQQSALGTTTYQPGHLLAGWSIRQSRDAMQRLTGLTLQSDGIDQHHSGYSYDHAGRLDSVEANGLAAYHHYDANHQRVRQISVVNPDGPVLYSSRSYDSLNRLERISYHNGDLHGSLMVFSDHHSTRDDSGRIRSTTLRDRTQWRYSYHASGELASAHRFLDASSDSLVAGHSHTWTYDGVGNRLLASRGGDSSGAGLRTAAFSPNALNQFSSILQPGAAEIFGEAPADTEVTVNGTTAQRQGPFFRHELTADNSDGPVWQPVTVASGPASRSGHLLIPPAHTIPTYDPEGNLLNDGLHAYSWDAENRLTQVASTPAATQSGQPYARVAYTYDSESRLIQRLQFDSPTATSPTTTTRFLYAGWRCLGELDANRQLTRTLTWGLNLNDSLHLGDPNGALLWMHDLPTHETHLAHLDGNGNLTGLSSAQSLQQTAHYLYSPFGNVLAATGPYAHKNPYRFSSHLQDPTTDLIYYGYRHLNPHTASWLSRDPLRELGGENLYGPAGNDLVNFHDVLGLQNSFAHAMMVAAAWGTVGSMMLDEVVNPINRDKANREAQLKGMSECDRMKDVLLKARLADAAYEGRQPPPDWVEIDSIHNRSGLDASVFQGPKRRTIIAFRGTTPDSRADWETNVAQGAGFVGDQYREIFNDPKGWARRFPDAEVVGHSLGGGLASVYGTKRGMQTTTFNPVGIHFATTAFFEIGGYSDYQKHVNRYTVRGEVLNASQDVLQVLVHESKGRRHKIWPAELADPVTLHVMDPVIAAIEKKTEKCCKKR